MTMRLLCFVALVAAAAAAPAHVVFVVDGAPEWGALLKAIPRADVLLRMAPTDGEEPESAAVASALSTGCLGERRAVSARGVPLGTRAALAGAATGAVTNACMTDPTVAAFFGTAPDRYGTATLAASVRAAGLAVHMGGASRLFLPPNATGDACFPTTRTKLAASMGACDSGRQMVGLFGDARSALAAECLPLPLATSKAIKTSLPSLREMTLAALSRLDAVRPGVGAFLVVGADRLDHAAHLGDVEACAAEVDSAAAAIIATLNAMAVRLRSDALVIVTGDHGTVMNGTTHTNRTVPLLIYGAGAVAAAERAVGMALSSAHIMHPPLLKAVDFPLMFPFFPYRRANRGCTGGDRNTEAGVTRVAVIVVFTVAFALMCAVCWKVWYRRKEE